MVDRTHVYIRVRQSVANDILPFLQDLAGYSSHQFFLCSNKEFKNMRVVYNRKIGFLEKRGLKKSVKMYEGTVLEIIRLSDKPIISEQTKRRSIKAALVSLATYIAGFSGIKFFSVVLLNQTLLLSLIPAIAAFLTQLAADIKISSDD